jgi:mycofactocin precursor
MEQIAHPVLPMPEEAQGQAPGQEQAHAPLGRLELSRMAPPRELEALRLEELTIDGICGVY